MGWEEEGVGSGGGGATEALEQPWGELGRKEDSLEEVP